MSRSLEEAVAHELDTLWQAAAFLCAGDPDRARALLLRVVTSAHRDPDAVSRPEDAPFLEERMMRPEPHPGADAVRLRSFADTDSSLVFERASRVAASAIMVLTLAAMQSVPLR